MDTTDHECPRLSNMVTGGLKVLVKKPALPYGKTFPILDVHDVISLQLLTLPSPDGLGVSLLLSDRCAVSPCG